MSCHECAATGGAPRPATAVCSGCGAGTCPEHTHETVDVVRVSSVGNPVERRTRRLTCTACSRAAAARAGGPA